MTFIKEIYSLKQTGLKIFIALSCFIAFVSCNEKTGKPAGNRTVEIKKENGRYTFYRNGKPFFVKGAVGNTHLDELVAAGGNTISSWDTMHFENIFNDAAKHNIAVVAGLDVPSGEYDMFYEDEKKTTALFENYKFIVRKFKNHPALLAWSLGNELQMPFSSNSSAFYKTYNRILKMIHTEDPNHPVTTTIINYQKGSIININWKIRDLDFISINTYNRLKDIPHQLSILKYIWNGPFMISEWSPNGGWESKTTVWQAPIENTSTKKAEQYRSFYKQLMPVNNSRFLGSLVFYWGNRHEYTHTWYSIFSEEGVPTEVKEALYDCWRDTITNHQSVKVKYMLIDSLGAKDNIILRPGSEHEANLVLDGSLAGDSLRYHWEIKKEDWSHWGHTYNNFIKPVSETGLLADSSVQNTRFLVPKKEGPYRIFVTAYNQKGFCATANTPFYVVE